MPLTATCHCGATRIEVAHAPPRVTECNCSFCAKRGALWAYYTPDQVAISGETLNTGYSSDPQRHMHRHCSICGCSTYGSFLDTWSGSDPDDAKPMVAVNARLLDDFDWTALAVEKVDGRNGW